MKNSASPSLAAKRKEPPHPITLDEWHHVFITVSCDRISCIIDGEKVGSLRSPGIAHETKTFVRLQVHRSIAIDDVMFWQKSLSER